LIFSSILPAFTLLRFSLLISIRLRSHDKQFSTRSGHAAFQWRCTASS
jgi:hypothetical protein